MSDGAVMRDYIVWVLVDSKGRMQTYTNGMPLIYGTRREAKADENSYDPRRKWRAARAILTVRPDVLRTAVT